MILFSFGRRNNNRFHNKKRKHKNSFLSGVFIKSQKSNNRTISKKKPFYRRFLSKQKSGKDGSSFDRHSAKLPKPKVKVIVDNNLITRAYGYDDDYMQTVVNLAHEKDNYVYTSAIDKELRNTKNPDLRRKLIPYAEKHRKEMVSKKRSPNRVFSKYPVELAKDRYVLDEARKAGVKIIVSDDNGFNEFGQGFGPIITKPNNYINDRKRYK